MARSITVTFLGNSKDLQRATTDAGDSTETLGSKMKRVGAIAATALAAGAILAGKALFDMTKGAIEDEAAQERLANALRNSGGATKEKVAAVESWISAVGRATGVADDEMRPALEKLVTATGDVAKAQDLMRLAMDVSAGSGKSLETVSAALARAQNGNVSSLSRLGISTKNAKGETVSFEEAQKRLGDAFEGAAGKKADTLQGKMDRLKLIMAEAGEAIGAKLIPGITKMADWFLNKGLPAISAFVGWVRDNLLPMFRRISDTASGSMDGLSGSFKKTFRTIVDAVKAFVETAREFWAKHGEDIKTLARNAWNVIKGIVKGALTIIRGVMKVVTGIMRGDWSKAWSGIKDILRGAWKILVSIVKGAVAQMRTLLAAALSAIRDRVRNAWDAIKAATREAWQRVVDAVRDKISDAVAKVRGIKGAVLGALAGAGSWLYQKGLDILQGLWNGLKAKWEQIKSWFSNLSLPNFPGGGGGGRTTGPGTGNLGKASVSSGALFSGPVSTYASTTGVAGVGGATGPVVINVSGALDPDAVARQIVTLLRRYQRVTGTPLGLS